MFGTSKFWMGTTLLVALAGLTVLMAWGAYRLDEETGFALPMVESAPWLEAPVQITLKGGKSIDRTIHETNRVITRMWPPQNIPAQVQTIWQDTEARLAQEHPEAAQAVQTAQKTAVDLAAGGQMVAGTVADEFFPSPQVKAEKLAAQQEIATLQQQIADLNNRITELQTKAHPHRRLIPPLGFLSFGGGNSVNASPAPIIRLPGLPGGGRRGGDASGSGGADDGGGDDGSGTSGGSGAGSGSGNGGTNGSGSGGTGSGSGNGSGISNGGNCTCP